MLVSVPYFYKCTIYHGRGHAVAQLVEALRCKPEVVGSISDGVTGIFSMT
jgi:hypothetical protein